MNKRIDDSERTVKILFYITSIIYVISLIIAFYINIKNHRMEPLQMTFVAALTPWIVPVMFKLLRLKPVYEIYTISNIFTYFASLLGSGFRGYSYPWFDKIVHFSSGWIFTTVAVMVFFFIRKSNAFENRREYYIFLIFINAMNIAIAEIWEFYEYAMLIFFDNDCIHHFSQGVHDSITDVMCATLAGIFLTLLVVRYYKKKKSNFFINVYEKFYKRNIQ